MQNNDNSWNLSRIFNITALMCAALNGNLETVRELISHPNIDINIGSI